jgi:hypothetical protein
MHGAWVSNRTRGIFRLAPDPETGQGTCHPTTAIRLCCRLSWLRASATYTAMSAIGALAQICVEMRTHGRSGLTKLERDSKKKSVFLCLSVAHPPLCWPFQAAYIRPDRQTPVPLCPDDCVRLFRDCGAHLSTNPLVVGSTPNSPPAPRAPQNGTRYRLLAFPLLNDAERQVT